MTDLLPRPSSTPTTSRPNSRSSLERTETAHVTFQAGRHLERRILNQTFFKQILFGEDTEILGVTLTPAYAAVGAWQPGYGQCRTRAGKGHERRQKAATATQEA